MMNLTLEQILNKIKEGEYKNVTEFITMYKGLFVQVIDITMVKGGIVRIVPGYKYYEVKLFIPNQDNMIISFKHTSKNPEMFELIDNVYQKMISVINKNSSDNLQKQIDEHF